MVDKISLKLTDYNSLYTVRALVTCDNLHPPIYMSFIIDTGCERTCISSKILDKFSSNLVKLGSKPVRTANGIKEEYTTFLDSIILGSKLKWKRPQIGIETIAFEDINIEEDYPVVGLLGTDFLRNFNFSIIQAGYLELCRTSTNKFANIKFQLINNLGQEVGKFVKF